MKRTLLLAVSFAVMAGPADSPSNLPEVSFDVFTPQGKTIPDAEIVLTPLGDDRRLRHDEAVRFRHGQPRTVRPWMYQVFVRSPVPGYGDYAKSTLILGNHYQRIMLGDDPRRIIEYASFVRPPEIVGKVVREEWLARDLVVRAVALADGPAPQATDAKVANGAFRTGTLAKSIYAVLLLDGFEILEAKSVVVKHAAYPAEVVFGVE